MLAIVLNRALFTLLAECLSRLKFKFDFTALKFRDKHWYKTWMTEQVFF